MATATTSRKQTLFYDRESGHYYRFIMPAPGCQCLLCDVCGRPLGGIVEYVLKMLNPA